MKNGESSKEKNIEVHESRRGVMKYSLPWGLSGWLYIPHANLPCL